jgi:hypothetical protein
VKSLGKGGYGEVLEGTLYKKENALNSENHIGPLAIKIFKNDDDFEHEKMIVESLKDDNGCICSFESENKTLKSNIVCGDYIEGLTDGSNSSQRNNVIVMDKIQNLNHIDNVDFNHDSQIPGYIEEIIAIILQTNLCLLGKGLFYCDYNLGNIAIAINKKDNTFSLTFLDYGAILPFNVQLAKLNNLYISTHPIFVDNIGSTYYNEETNKEEMLNYGTDLGPVELYATHKGLVANKVKVDLDEEQEDDTTASNNHKKWFEKNKYKLALNNTILNIFNIICCLTPPGDEDNKDGIWERRIIFLNDSLMPVKYRNNSEDTREKKIKAVMDAIIVQHPTIRILPTLRDTLLANANFKTGEIITEVQYRTQLNSLVSQICSDLKAKKAAMEEEKKRIGKIIDEQFAKYDRHSHGQTIQ